MMKAKEFIERLISIASDYKTLYVNGTWGWVMNDANKARACKKNTYNIQHKDIIYAASNDTFGFDCCGLIKGVLWGWNGDLNASYGGAGYACNGVPDLSEAGIINACSNVSADFSNIKPGEAVHMTGHIGVYIGDGLAVEATPAWENKVQITACNCDIPGYHRRNWQKHGFLPWIDYSEVPEGYTPVDITYQVYCAKRWQPNVVNQNDYAGVFGNEDSGIYANASLGNLTYCVHIMKTDKEEGYWEDEVVNREDYAGILGKPFDAFMIKSDITTVHYKVHCEKYGWLDTVTGYDKTDEDFGFAGIFGEPIDAVEIWADPVEIVEEPPKEEEPEFDICPLCGAYLNLEGECPNPLCKNNPEYQDDENPLTKICDNCGSELDMRGNCMNPDCPCCPAYQEPSIEIPQTDVPPVEKPVEEPIETPTTETPTTEVDAFKEMIQAICNFFVSLFKKLFGKKE